MTCTDIHTLAGLGPLAVACLLLGGGATVCVGRDAVISAACRLAAAVPPKKAGASMLSKRSSADGSSVFFGLAGCCGSRSGWGAARCQAVWQSVQSIG